MCMYVLYPQVPAVASVMYPCTFTAKVKELVSVWRGKMSQCSLHLQQKGSLDGRWGLQRDSPNHQLAQHLHMIWYVLYVHLHTFCIISSPVTHTQHIHYMFLNLMKTVVVETLYYCNLLCCDITTDMHYTTC